MHVLELEDEIFRLRTKIDSVQKGVSKLDNLLHSANLSICVTTFSLCGLAFVPLFKNPVINNLLSFFSVASSFSYLLHNLEMNYQLNKLENRVSN